MVDDKIRNNCEIPKDFWWAEGAGALTRNWTTGDFETWVRSEVHLRAFGVSFLRADIEKMMPSSPGDTGSSPAGADPPKRRDMPASSTKIFIVHGHAGIEQAVARFLRDLGFEPIVLHEQPNQGRTVIEKFELHSDVGFAVVLLTPDDVGSAKGGQSQPRARQTSFSSSAISSGRLAAIGSAPSSGAISSCLPIFLASFGSNSTRMVRGN
jgi:Predicted nucleotide-binding protein containing TIR-like domain